MLSRRINTEVQNKGRVPFIITIQNVLWRLAKEIRSIGFGKEDKALCSFAYNSLLKKKFLREGPDKPRRLLGEFGRISRQLVFKRQQQPYYQ